MRLNESGSGFFGRGDRFGRNVFDLLRNRLGGDLAGDFLLLLRGGADESDRDMAGALENRAGRTLGPWLEAAERRTGADAENNFSLDAASLVIKEAVIGAGPTLRRFKPRAKGSAGPILKRTSHISITLVGSAPEKKKKVARKVAAKPVPKQIKNVPAEPVAATEEA